MRRLVVAAFLLVAFQVTRAAAADNADPCSAFAWPMTAERTLLAGAAQTAVADGGQVAHVPPLAFRLALVPDANAKFAIAPQKAPNATGFGGSVSLGAPAVDGNYLVTLSSEGWIDVIQNNAAVASTAHSGAMNCPGMRKSVKFHLAAGAPLLLQISSAPSAQIDLAVTPASN